MKSKKLYFYFIVVILIIPLVLGLMSCKVDDNKTVDSKKTSSGVISLLDVI
jgi:hypothetical protein